MSVNRHRGEVEAVLDGQPYRLCLTLGALAELEDAYAASDLQALVARFASGKLAAGDLVRIIGAGLRGGGNQVGDDEVRQMTTEAGVAGFARIAADLLAATFGTNNGATPRP